MSRFLKLKSLTPYVPGEQPKSTEKLIKLNTNESPFPPGPEVLKAINTEAVSTLRLYSDPTCMLLRKAAAEYYGISPDMVCAGNGSDELLALIFHGLTPRGAVYPDITYGFYPVFSDMFGVKGKEIPLRDDFTIEVEDYRGEKGTVIIANPNAPTGLYLDEDKVRALLEQDRDRLVVMDEAYIDFGGESSVKLLGEYDNLLVVQTFSKSRQLAGERVAIAMGSPDVIGDLNTLRFSFNPYNLDTLAILAGSAAIKDREYFEKCRLEIISNREYTIEKLRGLGFSVTDSMANFVFAAPPGISGGEYMRALREAGILVRHFDKPRIDGYVRISIGTLKDMQTLISKTEEILRNA